MNFNFDFSRITPEIWLTLGISFFVSNIILYFINRDR